MHKHFKITVVCCENLVVKCGENSVCKVKLLTETRYESEVRLHLEKYLTNTNFVLKHLFHLTKCRERGIEKTTTFKIKDLCEIY